MEAAEVPTWSVHDPEKSTLTLTYDRLPVGYFVGGKCPRTLQCLVCGGTAVRYKKHYIHESVIALDSSNEPKTHPKRSCIIPAPPTEAQKGVMAALHSGRDELIPALEDTVLEWLEVRHLIHRRGSFGARRGKSKLTLAGELLFTKGDQI